MFPWCSTREDLSIDVSITNVGLILTKLRWFQLFVKSQNSNFELFWKINQIFGFPWCSTREDLSIDVSITNVGLILTKIGWFLFSRYEQMNEQTDGQTDRSGFGILIWKIVGTQKISSQSSKLGVSCRSLYSSPDDEGCIILGRHPIIAELGEISSSVSKYYIKLGIICKFQYLRG